MQFPNKVIVDRVRRQYPIGCRVELLKMDDMAAPPIGKKGTVYGVDDTANVLIHWDSGSCLNVIYGEDECRRVDAMADNSNLEADNSGSGVNGNGH